MNTTVSEVITKTARAAAFVSTIESGVRAKIAKGGRVALTED